MNPVIETIRQRRSVRLYDSKPVPKELLETIVQAGNLAPSGANSQPWRFVVITDEGWRRKFAALAMPRYQKWLENAPELIRRTRANIDASVVDPVFYSAPAVVFVIGWGATGDYDCAMACQNIMLTARAEGVGSCWVYFGQLVLDDEEIRRALEIKDGEKVYGPIVLGYPQGQFPPGPPKRPPVVKWL